MDDLALLREYAVRNSEAAFEELVARRVGFVYSAALRQVRDPHLAGEITQAVFIILAQKAGRISDQTILAGWLFKTTRYAAIAQTRASVKRSLRTAIIEKEFQMQTEIHPGNSVELWEQLSPLLDEALATLGEKDRQAVLLRFFENKSLAEVGQSLGTGEDTARKRVARALEKLHHYFGKRGVSSTTAIIAGAISANSIQAAPVGLAKTVSAVAITKGAAVSGSTLTLIKGALKIMAWTKIKIAVVIASATILAAGATMMVVNAANADGDRTLTLQVNPDVFIKNIMAQTAETMNNSSNNWGDIFMDMLRIQGVNCAPPHGIALNTRTGELTTQNTLKALEKIHQTVKELNQPGGRCDFLSRVPTQQAILFTARLFKLAPLDFDKLGLGQPNGRATRNESGWWMLESKNLNKLNQDLRSYGLKPFQAARINTGYGIAGDLFTGTPGQNVEFKCLPMASVDNPFGREQIIDLKVQIRTTGYFTSNPAGDWPDFANRTNCALFAEANVENGGALVFRAQNLWDSEKYELIALIEANIKTTK